MIVALVGDHGQRRATTWFGAGVAAIGTVAVFAAMLKPNGTSDTATMFILSGLALVVVPAVAKAIRVSRAAASPG